MWHENPGRFVENRNYEVVPGLIDGFCFRICLRAANAAVFAKDNPWKISHSSEILRRGDRDKSVIVAAGRFFTKLGVPERLPLGPEVWGDTAIPSLTQGSIGFRGQLQLNIELA
jgi:hypothetical protein